MARATNSPASRKKRKRMIRAAKGFYANRSRLYRYAKDAMRKAWHWATRDRKNRKREFRKLWIARINAGCRERGISYSRFIEGLAFLKVELDRKVLSDVLISNPSAFDELVAQAKNAIAEKQKQAKAA